MEVIPFVLPALAPTTASHDLMFLRSLFRKDSAGFRIRMHIETRTDQVRIAFVSLHSCGRTVDSHDTAPILHPDLQCIQFWGSEDLVTNVLKEDDDVVLS